jgi:hypothetical protein
MHSASWPLSLQKIVSPANSWQAKFDNSRRFGRIAKVEIADKLKVRRELSQVLRPRPRRHQCCLKLTR